MRTKAGTKFYTPKQTELTKNCQLHVYTNYTFSQIQRIQRTSRRRNSGYKP